MMAAIAETPDHDPRRSQPRTLAAAKSRYVTHDNGYGVEAFERDVARILKQDEQE